MAGFIWGKGGEKLTPEQVDRQRIAAALMAKEAGMTTPVASPFAGLNRALQGYLSGRDERRADTAENAGYAGADASIAGILSGLGGGTSAGGGASGTMGAAWTPDPVTTLPAADSGVIGGGNAGVAGAFPALEVPGANGNLGFRQGGGGADAVFRAELIAGGLPEHVADGILMNAADESAFNPTAVGDNGAAFGLLQWNGPRKAALEGFAAERGLNPADPRTQAQFTLYELQGPEAAAGRALMETTTPGEAAAVFVNQFERPAEVHRARREAAYLGGQGRTSGGGNVTMSAKGGGAPLGGIDIASLLALSSDPWVTKKYGGVIDALMGQQMDRQNAEYAATLAQADPRYQVQLEADRLALEEARQPKPVDPFAGTKIVGDELIGAGPDGTFAPVYTPPPKPGYRQLTPEEVSANPTLDPTKAYQVSPEGKIETIGGAGVTVNNQMGGDKFDEEFAKLDAKALADVGQAGITAQRNIARIGQLETVLATAPQGAGGLFTQLAGEWGISLGEGTSDVQAANAIINSLVPEQRPPGSGPMSDRDVELFKASLPRILNQPGGNAQIIATLKGLAEYDAAGAVIAQRLRAGEITRAQAFEELQARPNPLAGFKADPADAKSGGRRKYNPATGGFD